MVSDKLIEKTVLDGMKEDRNIQDICNRVTQLMDQDQIIVFSEKRTQDLLDEFPDADKPELTQRAYLQGLVDATLVQISKE